MDWSRTYPTQLRWVAGAVLLAAVLSARPLRRVVVAGRSMSPSLEPGDRLIFSPAFFLVRPGQVVVVADPRAPERLLVKRVAAVGRSGVDVRGDNPLHSTDSRHFGPLPRRAVAGRVLYRYWPAERSGWWPGR